MPVGSMTELLRNCKTNCKLACLSLFPKLKLHVLFSPLDYFLLNLAYLSRLSRWESQFSSLRSTQFANKFEMYKAVYEAEHLDQAIDYLEFGVASGTTFKWWVENNKSTNSRFIGFDTFEGLAEGWGQYEKGAFSTGGKTPEIKDPRAQFVKGFFQETLWETLQNLTLNKKTVIHLDADLYNSTIYVLFSFAHKLKAGDLLIFDEFSSPMHEFRAFMDFLDAMKFEYNVLGQVSDFSHIIIKIGVIKRHSAGEKV